MRKTVKTFCIFDTAAVEERRNCTVVFTYDHLPYNLLWNSGMEVRRMLGTSQLATCAFLLIETSRTNCTVTIVRDSAMGKPIAGANRHVPSANNEAYNSLFSMDELSKAITKSSDSAVGPDDILSLIHI